MWHDALGGHAGDTKTILPGRGRRLGVGWLGLVFSAASPPFIFETNVTSAVETMLGRGDPLAFFQGSSFTFYHGVIEIKNIGVCYAFSVVFLVSAWWEMSAWGRGVEYQIHKDFWRV